MNDRTAAHPGQGCRAVSMLPNGEEASALLDDVRVSCVIPTHRRPDFLREALESVAKQTLGIHEIVVVSDVDDPEAAELCREVSAQHGVRIEYVFDEQTPGGASASRNLGGYRASGTHVAFLDDDDWWDQRYLEKAVACLRSSGADIVVTWRNLVNAERVVHGPVMRPGLRAKDVAAISLGTTGSNMLVSRRAFLSVAGFDPRLPVKNEGRRDAGLPGRTSRHSDAP